jgi:hypothetical protein
MGFLSLSLFENPFCPADISCSSISELSATETDLHDQVQSETSEKCSFVQFQVTQRVMSIWRLVHSLCMWSSHSLPTSALSISDQHQLRYTGYSAICHIPRQAFCRRQGIGLSVYIFKKNHRRAVPEEVKLPEGLWRTSCG